MAVLHSGMRRECIDTCRAAVAGAARADDLPAGEEVAQQRVKARRAAGHYSALRFVQPACTFIRATVKTGSVARKKK